MPGGVGTHDYLLSREANGEVLQGTERTDALADPEAGLVVQVARYRAGGRIVTCVNIRLAGSGWSRVWKPVCFLPGHKLLHGLFVDRERNYDPLVCGSRRANWDTELAGSVRGGRPGAGHHEHLQPVQGRFSMETIDRRRQLRTEPSVRASYRLSARLSLPSYNRV